MVRLLFPLERRSLVTSNLFISLLGLCFKYDQKIYFVTCHSVTCHCSNNFYLCVTGTFWPFCLLLLCHLSLWCLVLGSGCPEPGLCNHGPAQLAGSIYRRFDIYSVIKAPKFSIYNLQFSKNFQCLNFHFIICDTFVYQITLRIIGFRNIQCSFLGNVIW